MPLAVDGHMLYPKALRLTYRHTNYFLEGAPAFAYWMLLCFGVLLDPANLLPLAAACLPACIILFGAAAAPRRRLPPPAVRAPHCRPLAAPPWLPPQRPSPAPASPPPAGLSSATWTVRTANNVSLLSMVLPMYAAMNVCPPWANNPSECALRRAWGVRWDASHMCAGWRGQAGFRRKRPPPARWVHAAGGMGSGAGVAGERRGRAQPQNAYNLRPLPPLAAPWQCATLRRRSSLRCPAPFATAPRAAAASQRRPPTSELAQQWCLELALWGCAWQAPAPACA